MKLILPELQTRATLLAGKLTTTNTIGQRKGYKLGNWYRVQAKLDDGTTQSVVIGLR